MPLFCSDAGSLAYIAPSGAVPGGDAGARGWLQKFIAGGEGLDGVSYAKVRVLYVKSLDYVVKVYFSRVLNVKKSKINAVFWVLQALSLFKKKIDGDEQRRSSLMEIGLSLCVSYSTASCASSASLHVLVVFDLLGSWYVRTRT
jgi:hypothetical protein